jgi:hypothetical protein
MIQVKITQTGKSYNPKDQYETFGHDTKTFNNLQEANKWLNETYGKSKRQRMYADSKQGANHIGYVIGFHNADWSHAPVNKWLQQDWIEFCTVESLKLS